MFGSFKDDSSFTGFQKIGVIGGTVFGRHSDIEDFQGVINNTDIVEVLRQL